MSKKEEIAKFHRKNILEAATALFRERGIEKTTMDDIAKKAEYSKATIYVYYRNKDELVNAMTLQSMREYKEMIEQSVKENTNILSIYHRICEQLDVVYRENPIMIDLLLGKINVDMKNPDTPQVFTEIYEEGEKLNRILYEVIKRGMVEGVFRADLDVEQTVMYLWCSISAMVKMAYEKEEYLNLQFHLSRKEFLTKQYELILKAILA